MIKAFLDIYKNFYLGYDELMSEIYYVLDIEFNLTKQDILLGKSLSDSDFKRACDIFYQRVKTLKPVQYIVKKAFFMNDIFEIDESVLIPRDDTQILVERALNIINRKSYKQILDIGTGSGIIAIEIKKNSLSEVFAVDICDRALEIAKKNASKMDVRVNFLQSDLFQNLNDRFDLIVSNPPYIPYSEKENLQKEVVDFEPLKALFADDDGLFFYKKIISESSKYLSDNGCLLFEVGINQAEAIEQIFKQNGFSDIFIEKDVSGIDRVVGAFLKKV